MMILRDKNSEIWKGMRERESAESFFLVLKSFRGWKKSAETPIEPFRNSLLIINKKIHQEISSKSVESN